MGRTRVRRKPCCGKDIMAVFERLDSSSNLGDLNCQCSSDCLRLCGVPDVDDPRNVDSDEIHPTLFLQTRKNDQVRFGSRIIVACWGPSSPMCQVSLTELLSKESRHAGQAPIFDKVIRGEQVPSLLRASTI